MTAKRIAMCSLIGMASLLFVGCGSGTSPEPSPAQPSVAPAPEVRVSSGEEATIPKDFPKDVPLYKSMNVQSITALTGGQAYVVQATTPDAFEQVDAAMKSEAEANGWREPEPSSSVRDTTMSVRNYSKAQRTLNITLFQQDAATVINISTGGG